jgi:hypothetical protein
MLSFPEVALDQEQIKANSGLGLAGQSTTSSIKTRVWWSCAAPRASGWTVNLAEPLIKTIARCSDNSPTAVALGLPCIKRIGVSLASLFASNAL